MLCTNCHKEVPDGVVNCPYCGSLLVNPGKNVSSQGNSYQSSKYYSESTSENSGGSGLSIASMVLGICSIVFCCYGGFVLGIVGLALGAVAIKQQNKGRNMAVAGIVTSIITLALSVLLLLGVGIGSFFGWHFWV